MLVYRLSVTIQISLSIHTLNISRSLSHSHLGDLKKTLDQATSWAIGPGLGRGKFMEGYFETILNYFEENKMITMDADSLWFLANLNKGKEEYKTLSGFLGKLSEKSTFILTPNGIEMVRLLQRYVDEKIEISLVDEITKALYKSAKEPVTIISREEAIKIDPRINHYFELLGDLKNVHLLVKGMADIVISGDQVAIVALDGGLKRCGGLGDLLTGFVSLYSQWSYNTDKTVLRGIIFGCIITRESTRRTYEKYKLSVIAQKVVDFVPETLIDLLDLNDQHANEKL